MYKLKQIVFNFCISLLSKTWKINISGDLPAEPSVVAFWHGEMLPVWKVFSRVKNIEKNAVVSISKDGEILANLLRFWDYKLIRGSSSKNAKSTLTDATDQAKKSMVFITPDGPRGPERKFKNGAAVIAFRASVPICFVRVRVSKSKVFTKSWDKFILPLPFSNIDVLISEQYFIPENSSHEEISIKIAEFEYIINSMV